MQNEDHIDDDEMATPIQIAMVWIGVVFFCLVVWGIIILWIVKSF